MRVAVTGGRDYQPTPEDVERFQELWDNIGAADEESVLFEGGARGVDAWAREWAEKSGIPCATVSVNTAIDGPWPAAGPLRSLRMLKAGKIQCLVVFPGGPGTSRAFGFAHKLGIRVEFVKDHASQAEQRRLL